MLNQAEIKRRREALGLTMQHAAERAGWKTKMDWNRFENGGVTDPRASTLYALATALGCPIEAILIPPTAKPIPRKR
jgi:transcriptional regulator with XRE-family HTH domain